MTDLGLSGIIALQVIACLFIRCRLLVASRCIIALQSIIMPIGEVSIGEDYLLIISSRSFPVSL